MQYETDSSVIGSTLLGVVFFSSETAKKSIGHTPDLYSVTYFDFGR